VAKKPKLPYLLGSVFIRKGYHRDSMDLGVDPNGFYDFVAEGGVLKGFWRTGLNRPSRMHTLTRTPQ